MNRLRGVFGACGSALLLTVLICDARPAGAADAIAIEIATFVDPTYLAVAPGKRQFLFVVERPGRIRLLRNEVPLPRPFLDIENIVLAGGERGLLSVAFPPDYDSSGRFYVAFTNKNGAIELDEFMRSANPRRADRGSRRRLLVIPHPGAENHNGGQLQFGPDGLLYMSTGDGGSVTPQGEAARDLRSLLGKILRIDPRPGANRPYRIPRDNPFVGMFGRNEIFAYGLRHLWRFSFDGKRMALADVGRQRREEVNLLHMRDVAGANFGWPQFEGDLVFDDTRPGPRPPTFPMFVYPHGSGRCAIIGGYVVRDQNLPALLGRYVWRRLHRRNPQLQAAHQGAGGAQ